MESNGMEDSGVSCSGMEFYETVPKGIEENMMEENGKMEYNKTGLRSLCFVSSFSQHFQVEREHKSQDKNYYKTKARYQAFNPALHARLVRIRIEAWRLIPCMALYLYGCDSRK